MKHWPHQAAAIAACEAAHAQPRSRVLVQFPTGAGKTEVAIAAAVRYARRPFGRVLLVLQSGPILEQFARRLATQTRLPIAIDKAERHAPYGARLVLASQNSLWDRLTRYDPKTLCIYDECHHANFDAAENLKIAQSFDHVVGLSASPWSRGCEAMFADAARFVLTLDQAQQAGVVAPLSLLPWDAPQGPHGLVFCGSNEGAEASAKKLPGASWVGVNSGDVAARIAAWRAGRHPVLFANRMLSEGFDEPACADVWISVESDSDIRLVQMAGRALRARPGKVARVRCRTPAIARLLRRALLRAGWSGRTEPALNPV